MLSRRSEFKNLFKYLSTSYYKASKYILEMLLKTQGKFSSITTGYRKVQQVSLATYMFQNFLIIVRVII